MKKVLLFALMLVALASCKNDVSFTINGDATGVADGTMVRLQQRVKPDWIVLDSAIIKDGKFTLEGQVDPGFMAYIEVEGYDKFQIILEPGEINVDCASKRAHGTPSNEKMAEYLDNTEEFDSLEDEIYAKLDSASDSEREALSHQIDSIDAVYIDYIKLCMKENITNPFGIGLFTSYASLFADDVQMLLDLSDLIPKEYRAQTPVSATIKALNNIARTSVGSKYLDFEFQTVDGRQTSLAECVNGNRYVLIDFWASWCAPCRASLPGIKALNDKYGDKGLCIIGVSLDKEQESWLSAIQNFQMTWIQTSALQFWDDEIAALYGVRAIPATVLIDGNGTIVDRNVDVDALSEKLAKELSE